MAANATAPLHGLVTTCSSARSCDFVFNTSGVFGYANASPPSMSLRLPGEPLTSAGLSYSAYTAKLTGTYTYWTVGNFVGTDINTGLVVYGTTNTNYTITCYGHSGRGGGCTYKYTTDNGTIVVFFTQAEQTATTVGCAPSTIGPGFSTVCTATVNDTPRPSTHPSGNVSFSGSYGSTVGFSNGGICTLLSGSCSVSYTAPDEQLGTVAIVASFQGTSSFYPSGGTTSIYVNPSGGGANFSNVFFSESGLANGTQWSVTFGGHTLVATNASIQFEVQNGTYAFSVGSIPGYTLSPAAGNVTVSGSDVGVTITFTPVSYAVTFTESGLPLGKSWSVRLDVTVVRTTNLSLSFNETNGTHSYLISGPAGFQVSGVPPAGAITVAGAPSSLSFTFVRSPTYSITFAEKGLPKNSTWCVVVGTIACSSVPVLRWTNLTPTTYAYAIVPMVGQVIVAKLGASVLPLNGNLTLSNHSLRIALHYAYPYLVMFTQSGLPNGTNWTVTIGGVTHYSTNATITFELGNGTHFFQVRTVPGYLHASFPTVARVVGGPVSVSVAFRP